MKAVFKLTNKKFHLRFINKYNHKQYIRIIPLYLKELIYYAKN